MVDIQSIHLLSEISHALLVIVEAAELVTPSFRGKWEYSKGAGKHEGNRGVICGKRVVAAYTSVQKKETLRNNFNTS